MSPARANLSSIEIFTIILDNIEDGGISRILKSWKSVGDQRIKDSPLCNLLQQEKTIVNK